MDKPDPFTKAILLERLGETDCKDDIIPDKDVVILQMRLLTVSNPLALAAIVLALTTSIVGAAEERIAGGRQALRAMPGANQQRWVSALKLSLARVIFIQNDKWLTKMIFNVQFIPHF